MVSKYSTTSKYAAADIEVLEGLEPVQKRPGMYIGGVDKRGYHHLLWEILDNAVDEVINGHASTVKVTLSKDHRSATVVDNGRGIPVDKHPKHKKPALEIIMTTLHAGGKFSGKNYVRSGGLHGVGASVANALSEKMTATVRRDGKEYEQSYRRGTPTGKVEVVRKGVRGSGTEIAFTPDKKVFGELLFDPAVIAEHLEAKAYLHRGMKVVFRDEKAGETVEYLSEGGLADLLHKRLELGGKKPSHDGVFTEDREEDDVRMEIALVWTSATEVEFRSFANGVRTPSGGTHENGLKNGLVKALRQHIDDHAKIPKGVSISAEDIREGVVAVLSVYIPEPQFQGQTKERLNNPGVTRPVESWTTRALEQWLLENPSAAEAIVERVIMSARARQQSREAVQAVRKSAVSHRLNLPGKLADCSNTEPSRCELFIVEGDSAGGTAKMGRDRKTQAILPVRGKVLNAEQASLKKVLENKELGNIVQSLGCGIGKTMDLSKLRYHKVCLLMDADSDGHHIATLLLTFFYRHMKPLVAAGHVFLAQPPLYRIEIGKDVHWVADDAAKERLLGGANGKRKVEVQRFKGLGEMNAKTLRDTTLDPGKRTLLRVTIDDAEATDQTVRELMGKEPSYRFQFITEQADEAEADALDI